MTTQEKNTTTVLCTAIAIHSLHHNSSPCNLFQAGLRCKSRACLVTGGPSLTVLLSLTITPVFRILVSLGRNSFLSDAIGLLMGITSPAMKVTAVVYATWTKLHFLRVPRLSTIGIDSGNR